MKRVAPPSNIHVIGQQSIDVLDTPWNNSAINSQEVDILL